MWIAFRKRHGSRIGMLSARPRVRCVAREPQAWSGEVVPVELWVSHDPAEKLVGASWVYEVKLNGKGVAHGKAPAKVPACSSLGQGILPIKMPRVEKTSVVQVGATLLDASGKPIHDRTIEFRVFPRLSLGELAPWVAWGIGREKRMVESFGPKSNCASKRCKGSSGDSFRGGIPRKSGGD